MFDIFLLTLHPFNYIFMNKTAEIVNQWADFESKHPEEGIAEFCRYYLASRREAKESSGLFDGEMPPRSDIILIKLIDRIARLHMIYIDIAMKDLKIDHFEEFSLLSATANLNNPRKTEVIYHTINELSTGLNLLAGMKKRGYITEHNDTEDRRSKRLKLTQKGEKILRACYEKFAQVPEMMLKDMSRDDIDLCIQLLKNIEIKFSKLYLQHRDKTFEQVYQNIKGEKIV
jgi:DNA-binding MarR family transcriptional regulator